MANSPPVATSGFARCSRQPKVEIQQIEKVPPLRSGPNNQLSEAVLWLAAFATFVPGNLIWIWYLVHAAFTADVSAQLGVFPAVTRRYFQQLLNPGPW